MTTATDRTQFQKVLNATTKLLIEDSILFTLKGNERSITSRLNSYIQEEYPEFNVDHEYNKNLKLRKLITTDVNRPGPGESADIVIHRRMSADSNHIAIEVKAGKDSNNDREKLASLTNTEGKFRYRYGIYLVFSSGSTDPKIAVAEVYRDGNLSKENTYDFRRLAGVLMVDHAKA